MALLFTNHDGSPLEIDPTDYKLQQAQWRASTVTGTSLTISSEAPGCHDGAADSQSRHCRKSSHASIKALLTPSSPLSQVHNVSDYWSMPTSIPEGSREQTPAATTPAEKVVPELPDMQIKRKQKQDAPTPTPFRPEPINPQPRFCYNEYSELVEMSTLAHPPRPQDMTALQVLRLMRKVYQREFCEQMRDVIVPLLGDITACTIGPTGKMSRKGPMSYYDLSPDLSEVPRSSSHASSECLHYKGPPRMLDIGCGIGTWCFAAKTQFPEWIVEGVDDVDRWSAVRPDLVLRDFMENVVKTTEPEAYFSQVHMHQVHPEFTVRSINSLLRHASPLRKNLYSFIRSRNLFDKLENWPQFLDDVRCVLKPGGCVEMIEIDPRPRCYNVGISPKAERHDAAEYWSERTNPVVRHPRDEELATMCSEWLERVTRRQESVLRPVDGWAAQALKERLQGCGFDDVKELILRMPIGGTTEGGQRVQKILLQQFAAEDEIPVLLRELPKVNLDDLAHGDFFMNLHVVTGSRPMAARTGDLLRDGSRKDMTPAVYEAMSRLNDAKSNQNQRFDLDGKLSTMMSSMTSARGTSGWIPPDKRTGLVSSSSSSGSGKPKHKRPLHKSQSSSKSTNSLFDTSASSDSSERRPAIADLTGTGTMEGLKMPEKESMAYQKAKEDKEFMADMGRKSGGGPKTSKSVRLTESFSME